MPRGDKSAYTGKQQRQAGHIEQSEREQGRSQEDAERIAWATVNKQDGGGKKSGSGRKPAGRSPKKAATGKTAKKPVRTSPPKTARKSAGKRAS